MRRLLEAFAGLALLVAASLSPALTPALAIDMYGYWAMATADGEVRLGLVFPDFSPNEFAGIMFACQPGTAVVAILVDMPTEQPAGSNAPIVLTTPGGSGQYRGSVEIMQPDDRVVARASTTLQDPLFEELAKAPSLTLTAGGKPMELPVRNAARMVPQFLLACEAAGAPRPSPN